MNRDEAINLSNKLKFSRKEAREFAMQTVFQMEAQKELEADKLKRYLNGKAFGAQTAYVNAVLSRLLENIEYVNAAINKASDGWSTDRMAKPDLAVIRIAVSEMMYMDDIPNSVAINEAVSLSKLYGTEQSPRFVNAVLGKIQKDITRDE